MLTLLHSPWAAGAWYLPPVVDTIKDINGVVLHVGDIVSIPVTITTIININSQYGNIVGIPVHPLGTLPSITITSLATVK
jgi:hypothetical protein